MSKEQQELLNEAYRKYADSHEYFVDGWLHVIPMEHSKETFINKCKINPEFSEKWGLKIEERELSYTERYDIHKEYITEDKLDLLFEFATNENLDKLGVPIKLITITRNDKTIESYE
jgi:hypothetical protein